MLKQICKIWLVIMAFLVSILAITGVMLALINYPWETIIGLIFLFTIFSLFVTVDYDDFSY